MRILLSIVLTAALVTPSLAADNAIVLTPGSGVTTRSKDVGGGIQSSIGILGDTSGNPLATAPGTGNTSFALPIQGVASGIAVPISGTVTANAGSGTFTVSGTVTANLGTLNGAATAALQTTGNTSLTTINTTLGSPMQNSGGSVTANLGTLNGAATAALQGTNTGTTAHTCSTGGYSELGCLGQIDDDVKGAVPALNATAYNTNSYTTGGTNPVNADLNGNLYANISKFGGTAVVTGTGTGGAGIPRVTVSSDSFPTTQAISGQINVTPADCSTTITSGGTAQNIIAASSTLHGFTIGNIDASAGSGEPLWMSFTGTAAPATVGSYPLSAPTATTFAGLSSYTTPVGFGTNHAVSIIGTTTGHKISCTQW